MNTENPQGKSEYIHSKMSIKLDKLAMGLTESVKVMTKVLKNLPKSGYAINESDDTQDLNISEADTYNMEEVPYISSDETEAY